MSELRVDTVAVDLLSDAFRIVATVGIPTVDPATTGHAQLDAAVSELCLAVEALSSGSNRAVEAHADSLENAAGRYRTTEQIVARSAGPL